MSLYIVLAYVDIEQGSYLISLRVILSTLKHNWFWLLMKSSCRKLVGKTSDRILLEYITDLLAINNVTVLV